MVKSLQVPKKLKIHHGWYVCVMIIGWLVPPLAVLMRFGICKDFFINIVFTIMGYIPGHVHNFYLQNIRKNHGRNRTPKWAIRYGLVPDYNAKVAKKRQWAHTYNERVEQNQYDNPAYLEEDEWGRSSSPVQDGDNNNNKANNKKQQQNSGLDPALEQGYYNNNNSTSSRQNSYLSGRELDRYSSRDSIASSFSSGANERSRKKWLASSSVSSRHHNNSFTDANDRMYNINKNYDNVEVLDEAPGAGERKAKQQRKKGTLRTLVTGAKARDRDLEESQDRFSKMERQRQKRYYDDTYADLQEQQQPQQTDPLSQSNSASSPNGHQTKRSNSTDPLAHEF